MLIGQFEHRLEEKGRLSIPKKFRHFLGDLAVITKGLDGCLFVFPQKKWTKLIGKLSTLPLSRRDARSFSRHLTFGAVEAEFDSQGRVLIPGFLRLFAEIKKEVVVAGALDRIEIWSKERFVKYQAELEKDPETIAEKLAELGI
jgi:MraZ protein